MDLKLIQVSWDGSIIISDVEAIELPKTFRLISTKEGYLGRNILHKYEIDTLINDNSIFTFNVENAKDILIDIKRKELVIEERKHTNKMNIITKTLTGLL